jgi:predicted O-linked N-acetylglucosamine transferase (SPINDLY family)
MSAHPGEPPSPVACFERGVLAAERGRVDEAAAWYERAIEQDPTSAEAHLNLGVIAERRGDYEEAARRYERALELRPGSALASQNLAVALALRAREAARGGSLREAIALFEQAIQRNPRSADAWFGLGVACAESGERARAEVCYEVALLARPEHAEALNNLGVVLQDRGDLARATECFERAAALAPASPEPPTNLGVLHMAHHRFDEARAAFERAVALDPAHAAAWNNLGILAQDLGDVRAALRHYRRAARLHPEASNTQQNILRALCYLPGVSPKRRLEQHAAWGRRFEAASPPLEAPAGLVLDPERPLRVGYLSPDFRTHSVSYFVDGVLANHGPEIAAYCYSASRCVDTKTIHLQRLAHAFRSVDGLSAREAAETIRRDGIDLLVDLAGHTSGNRLDVMALRPAPVQLTYLGYPATTGLSAIDYRITDALADPPGPARRATEELVRMPGCFLCYTPFGPIPDVAPPPHEARGHVTFTCFNDLAKVNDRVLDAWGRILGALPSARLLLKARAFASRAAVERLHARLAARGVSPERVECRRLAGSAEEHLATYAEADVALDTFPYAGTTTTCEALLMGVPVITASGQSHAENVGRSLLHAAGLPELVARSADGYVALACALAGDGPRLSALRRSLRPRLLGSRLCDARAFTRDLEQQYRALWRRHCAAAP